MTTNYHTPWEDSSTEYNEADMNVPLSELDTAITNLAATVDGLDFSGSTPYIIGIYFPGVPENSQIIFAHTFSDEMAIFYSDLAGSKAKSQDAATAQTVLTLKKNGVEIGTITWSASGTSGTFSFEDDVIFEEDDELTIHNQASADATLGRISLTLKASRIPVTTTSTTTTTTTTTSSSTTSSSSSSSSSTTITTTSSSTTTTTTAP